MGVGTSEKILDIISSSLELIRIGSKALGRGHRVQTPSTRTNGRPSLELKNKSRQGNMRLWHTNWERERERENLAEEKDEREVLEMIGGI